MSEAAAPVYSERLGAISDAQFAEALARFGLGDFVAAETATTGFFRQNVFLTSTTGAFVFRGAPHWWRDQRDDRYQFAKEAFFIRQVQAATAAPAPCPCFYDPAADIFEWPYLIMPRMPGECFTERSLQSSLPSQGRREVAVAMGETLGALQQLSSHVAGDFDPDVDGVAPEPFANHLAAWTTDLAVSAEAAQMLAPPDLTWIQAIMHPAPDRVARPVTFSHGDYKLDNMTFAEQGGVWRATGLFDFHTARFGDNAADLSRAACGFLDTEPELARAFVDAWRGAGGDIGGLTPWLPLYVVSERIAIWRYVCGFDVMKRTGEGFRSWCERYLERLAALL